MATTADSLVSRVLRGCHWPTGDGNAPLSYAEILQVADELIEGEFYPQLFSSGDGEDYYLSALDYAITAAQRLYRLPKRSMGPISDVVLVSADGDETSIDKVEAYKRAERGYTQGGGSGAVSGYSHSFEGDFIALFPTPSSTDGTTLRIKYPRQPSALALVATCSAIVTFTSTTEIVVGDGTLFSGGDDVDVIGQGNAFHGLSYEKTIASIATDTLTMTDAVNALTEAGDWVAPVNTTPLVQLPNGLHAALVRAVVIGCLRANGENAEADSLEREHVRLLKAVSPKPRSRAEVPVVRASNSPLRAIIGGGRW